MHTENKGKANTNVNCAVDSITITGSHVLFGHEFCTLFVILATGYCFTVDANVKALTYLLTPWCRVLLEQLTGLQLVKKFPAFQGT